MKYIITLLLLLSCSVCFAQPMSYWNEREQQAKSKAWEKLQKEQDVCDVCDAIGKSSEMYKAQKYGVGFYEGEFIRVHVDCMTPDYFVIEAPAGHKEFEFTKWMENKTRMERLEIARLFPFLDILDDLIDWTASITFYKVKNNNNKKTYELYKWEGLWQTREKQKDGKYNFLGVPK